MPRTSRRFRAKAKNREWALKQGNNPLRTLRERKRWMMEKESTGREWERDRERERERERGREGEFASKPWHRGGSKVCALHHNGHPVTNTDEPGCVMLHSLGWYLMGKQVFITLKSMDVPCYLTARLFCSDVIRENQDCMKKKTKNKKKKLLNPQKTKIKKIHLSISDRH